MRSMIDWFTRENNNPIYLYLYMYCNSNHISLEKNNMRSVHAPYDRVLNPPGHIQKGIYITHVSEHWAMRWFKWMSPNQFGYCIDYHDYKYSNPLYNGHFLLGHEWVRCQNLVHMGYFRTTAWTWPQLREVIIHTFITHNPTSSKQTTSTPPWSSWAVTRELINHITSLRHPSHRDYIIELTWSLVKAGGSACTVTAGGTVRCYGVMWLMI